MVKMARNDNIKPAKPMNNLTFQYMIHLISFIELFLITILFLPLKLVNIAYTKVCFYFSKLNGTLRILKQEEDDIVEGDIIKIDYPKKVIVVFGKPMLPIGHPGELAEKSATDVAQTIVNSLIRSGFDAWLMAIAPPIKEL